MSTFIGTNRGIINKEHVTHVTPIEKVNGESEVRVYLSDGHTVKLVGDEAERAHAYFAYISILEVSDHAKVPA